MAEAKNSDLKTCPISHSHQRLRQAHILWHQASDNYQNVDLFLTNVNSLIQELRNITFILQSEKSAFKDFEAWYAPQRETLKKDPHGKWLVEARNLIVKQGALATSSHFNVTFLTYESIAIASLLTDNDLSILSLLTRSDFVSIIARLRIAMREQGDAVIAIERCWSTPEVMGSELLEVLGRLYGILAKIVLQAHVHLGSLDCISDSQSRSPQHSEFPERQGRSDVLPCMMRAQAARTDHYSLNTFHKLSLGSGALSLNIGLNDVLSRYEFTATDFPKAFDSIDPLKVFEKIAESSKQMLRKDRSLARHMMIRDGRGEWSGHLIMTRNRLEKYLMMHLLAQCIKEEGSDAIIEVSETWVFDKMPPMAQLENAHRLPDRKEAISIVLATRDGLRKHVMTPFMRGPLGGFKFSETKEIDDRGLNYLKPIYRVWHEQNKFVKGKSQKMPLWQLDQLVDCLCGSSRRFGVCCLPLINGPEGSIENSDDYLLQDRLLEAERHARAGIRQYAIWIRQHTALLLNLPDRKDIKGLIAMDCLALEGYLSRLERWALTAGEVDAVSNTYRRLEEVLGIPVIVRRVVALGARWLIKNRRIEEGILELDRLGPTAQLDDTIALSLSAKHGDQQPEESIRLLESAVNFALDDDERDRAQLNLADYLRKQGLQQPALEILYAVLKETEDPDTIRCAIVLRWEISRSEDDFQSLFDLIDQESEEDSRLSAAAYLFEQGKRDAALSILQSLLKEHHPFACLLAAESDIRHGDSIAALERLSTIKANDSSPIEVRTGLAHLNALLVLDCNRDDMRQTALEQLVEVGKLKPSSHIDQLIANLKVAE